jgi:hypothetical protein
MDKRRRALIASCIASSLMAVLGSVALYRITKSGLLGEKGRRYARHRNPRVMVVVSPIAAILLNWLDYKIGDRLSQNSQ